MAKDSGGVSTMAEATFQAIRKVLEKEVWTSFQATVDKYDPATRQADVKGVMKMPDSNGEATIEVDLFDVPVSFVGGDNFTVYGDITGATVQVNIPKIDSSNYIFGKGRDSESEPLFSLNGAICTPLAVDPDGKWKAIPSKEAGIRVDTGNALFLGDAANTFNIVGVLVEFIDLLSGNVDNPGLGSTGTNSLILADLTALKNRLTPFEPS